MTTSITLRSTKGSALTHSEMDANLTNLQTTADAAKAATDTLTSNKAEATALGVANTDQNMGSFTGTTIADNVSAKAGMQSLETAVETKATAAALGVTATASNMGTYTGGTIPDNETAKQNLQSLETAVEARAVSATLAATGGAALIGANDASSGAKYTTVQGFLTYLLSSVGSAIVGVIQSGTGAVATTVQAKLRERVSVLDFGAVGDGVTDDTTAITNALATTKDVVFPEGYTFLTAGNHTISTNYQKLIIRGTVKKKSGTVQSIFVVNDQTTGILFTGGGIIDGNRTAFTGGNAVSGILAFRAINMTVDDLLIQNCIDDAIKAHNCPNLVVTASVRIYNIYNIGVEMRSYGNDPRTGTPWSGTVYGPSGDIDGFYDRIDDGLHGAGNGVGVDSSPGDATAPDIGPFRIRGRYRDCLRAIFFENNVASTVNVQDIVIDSPVILGNYLGSATVETKDGIGIVNCKNVQIISPVIRNVGNFAPAGGNCAGIQISGDDVSDIDIINPQIIDDTGAANRTDYGIFIGTGTSDNIRIMGGRINGTSDGNINKGGAVNLRIEGVQGATDDESWGNIVKFHMKVTDIPASANTSLLWDGEAGQDAAILGPTGRVVMVVARLNATISSGSLGFKTYIGATEQTALEIVNGDWGGGAQVIKKVTATAANQAAAGSQLKVIAVSSGLSPTTIDAIVEVYVDIGMKA